MKLQRAVHFEVLKGVRSRAKHGSGSVYQIVIAAPAEPRAAVAAVVYFTVEKVASIISRINLRSLPLSWSIRDITSGNYIGCEI